MQGTKTSVDKFIDDVIELDTTNYEILNSIYLLHYVYIS